MASTIKVAKPSTGTRVRALASPELVELEDNYSERHAFIPDARYAKEYIHRTVHGVQDFKLLDHCLKNSLNLLMAGDTGAGKTMFPMAYAAANSIPYYTVPCDVSIDPTALFGKMMPTDAIGKFEWVDGPVTELVRYGGILNISEINFMPAKIAASLYSLLDHRRSVQLLGHHGEHVKANRDLLIVADMNPKYRGTMDLNLALANRFPLKVSWGYDTAVENKLVQSKALLDLVRRIRKQDEIRTPIGTNMMMEFVDATVHLGIKFASASFVNAFVESERDAVSKMLDVVSVNVASEIGKLDIDTIEELPDDPDWFKKEDADDYEIQEVG